jgi:hypothetical protein
VLAAEEIEGAMDSWFAVMLNERGQSHERIASDGRLALLLCDGPEKWPYAFLDSAHPPAEFTAAMRAGAIEAGPDLQLSSMVPRQIDLGPLPEVAGETIERIERWPIVRMLLLWGFFAAVLAAIFRATR